MKKILTYIGEDSHSRPVYRDEDGVLYKDSDPWSYVPAALVYSKEKNVVIEKGDSYGTVQLDLF